MNDIVQSTANLPQVTPMKLLQMAVQQGGNDLEKMKQLMDLQERWEANEARKAFVVALNTFKANPPVLTKNKQVSFTTAKGRTEYKHATLDQVSGVIGAALAQVGISHRWDVEQLDGGRIRVTCILTHSLGHSERVPLSGSPDDSGGKNSIQGIGSTVTYLQRYTLLAATGMAVRDGDDDGRGGIAGMDEKVKADFLAAVDGISDMPGWESLWQKITAATTASRDVEAHEELRSAMARRRKELK